MCLHLGIIWHPVSGHLHGDKLSCLEEFAQKAGGGDVCRCQNYIVVLEPHDGDE